MSRADVRRVSRIGDWARKCRTKDRPDFRGNWSRNCRGLGIIPVALQEAATTLRDRGCQVLYLSPYSSVIGPQSNRAGLFKAESPPRTNWRASIATSAIAEIGARGGLDTLLPEQIARRAAFHRLVRKVFVDAHTWIASSRTYHASALNSGQSFTTSWLYLECCNWA